MELNYRDTDDLLYQIYGTLENAVFCLREATTNGEMNATAHALVDTAATALEYLAEKVDEQSERVVQDRKKSA